MGLKSPLTLWQKFMEILLADQSKYQLEYGMDSDKNETR